MRMSMGVRCPGQEDPYTEPPVPNKLRPVPDDQKAPGHLPEAEDVTSKNLDWGPLAPFTGTRPVVDKYTFSRFSLGEWRTHNKCVLNIADVKVNEGNLLDWNTRQILEQARVDIDKNQENCTIKLLQRDKEVIRWKSELERAIKAAAEDIHLVEQDRRRLKCAMSALMMPESIAGECLHRRTERLDQELVKDEVENEVIKEVALTAEIRRIFTRTLKDVEKQLSENKVAKQLLEYDWSDKKEAENLEAYSIALNTRSNVMLFKPGSVIFPDNQSTPEHWENFTRNTLKEAEATRQRSAALRGTLDAILTNASRDLRCQADRVDAALSDRIACTDQVKKRLEIELKKVLRRLADGEELIRDLNNAVRSMDIPMKKAQTRLCYKTRRARVENCRDNSQFCLIEEVKRINENISALLSQLRQAQQSQEDLVNVRNKLEREILVKNKTLETDRTRTEVLRTYYPSATILSGY